MNVDNESESANPTVEIELCMYTHCHEINNGVATEILDTEQFAKWKAEETVRVAVNGIQASLRCSTCLGICSNNAAAQVTVGAHSDKTIYKSAGEFEEHIRQVVGRTEVEWAEAEKPDFETEEDFERWLAEMRKEGEERRRRTLEKRQKDG